MLDIQTLTTLAASVVSLLSALLGKAVDKGAEEVGKSIVTTTLEKLKARFNRPSAIEALEELEKNPTSVDNQTVLRVQILKSLQADVELIEFFERVLKDLRLHAKSVGVTQSAEVSGAGSIIIQNAGDGNSISVG